MTLLSLPTFCLFFLRRTDALQPAQIPQNLLRPQTSKHIPISQLSAQNNISKIESTQPMMPTLLSLPDELLLQILSHNTPHNFRSRSDFVTHIRKGAITKRLLRLHRDSFFHNFVHHFSITCLYSAPSPRNAYTQVRVDGVLTARASFLEQVRKVDVRLYVYYKESVEIAVGEIIGVLQRYKKLRWLRVGVSTGSWEVAEMLGRKIEGLIEEERGKGLEKRVEVFVETELMGVAVEGK